MISQYIDKLWDYKSLFDDYKPSGFFDYAAFCVSHKATVTRIKKKWKR